MELIELSEIFPYWLVPWLVSAASLCVMLILKRVILVRLEYTLASDTPDGRQLLIRSANTPLTMLIIAANVLLLVYLLAEFQVALDTIDISNSLFTKAILIIAIILFTDRFTLGLFNRYTSQSETLKNNRTLVKGTIRIIIYVIGLLVLLGTLGISITPIVASLGITSLAVALALQPTLENFFSGLQQVMDKPIRVGDFIELDFGEQGFVEKIGWRSTWIKMLPNNMVIMPNSKLSQSKLINYFYPQKELSVPVEVSVHYQSDLEQVERVTLEVARKILKEHEWGVTEYQTFVLFHTFDNSSINFTVMLRAKEYFNRFWVKSAFIKALHKRYAEEGISIPFPITAINLEQEDAGKFFSLKPE